MAAAERTITLGILEGSNYIDIAQCLSAVNRKLYRQGMQYAIESLTFTSNDATGNIRVRRINEAWYSTNAHQKAYIEWKSQQDDAAKDAGAQSMRAKWRDFKVCMDLGS